VTSTLSCMEEGVLCQNGRCWFAVIDDYKYEHIQCHALKLYIYTQVPPPDARRAATMILANNIVTLCQKSPSLPPPPLFPLLLLPLFG